MQKVTKKRRRKAHNLPLSIHQGTYQTASLPGGGQTSGENKQTRVIGTKRFS